MGNLLPTRQLRPDMERPMTTRERIDAAERGAHELVWKHERCPAIDTCPICRLAALARELAGRACGHGWRGHAPERGERIVTPCPACGGQSLFIGSGGHLTCASVPKDQFQGCPSPGVDETVKRIKAERDAAREALRVARKILAEAHSYLYSEFPEPDTAMRILNAALAAGKEGSDGDR